MSTARRAFEEAQRRISAWRDGETLDLAIDGLETIPGEICALKTMHDLVLAKHWSNLDCSRTQITDLTPLSGLKALQSLNCWGTQITDLTPLLGLEALQSFDCSDTKITDLTPLSNLKTLQSLNCCGTQISDLTPLSDLEALQRLYCSDTQITDLTPLSNHKALQSLNCSRTQITDLMPLSDLEALQSLYCSRTQITDLTPLSNLKALQSLDCWDTQITDLTPLSGLETLQSLNCDWCSITIVPRAFWFMPALKTVNLFGAALPDIPVEVLSQSPSENCLASIQAHFADLDGEAERLSDAKLMVLGNGQVGKTQICRKLHGKIFDDKISSTHGIIVSSTPAPYGPSQKDGQIIIWDFGGQDIYHGTHALFMRSRAIFMIVWTPEMEANEKTHIHEETIFRNYPLPYWLEYVRRFGGEDSPVIIVQSQCDAPEDEDVPSHVAMKARKGFHFCKILQYSAKKDRGRASLDEALAEAFARIEKPLIGIGRAAVKRHIERLRDKDATRPESKRRHRTMHRSEFDILCEKTGRIGDAGQFLQFLHNAGTVFYRPHIFNNQIIIDQGWALEAIYAVFHRAGCYQTLEKLGGRFDQPMLGRLLWNAEGYTPAEQTLFIDMMRSCGVCFQHREADREKDLAAEYIAPDLLPHDPPLDLTAKWDSTAPTETATFEYDLLPPTLMRAIMARIGQAAGLNADYWRSGLFTYEAGSQARALIQHEMDGDWHGRVIVQTQKGQALQLLEMITELVMEEEKWLGVQSSAAKASVERRENPEDNGTASPIFKQPPRKQRTWFVSYARDDNTEEGGKPIDKFCESARANGIDIQRDEAQLAYGESISRFMDRLATGNRVFVFLSDAYLRSPFCMYELHQIWRNAKGEDQTFLDRIRTCVWPSAKIWSPSDRYDRAVYWGKEFNTLNERIKRDGILYLGERDLAAFQNMDRFARNVGDILALIADHIQAVTPEELKEYGFGDE